MADVAMNVLAIDPGVTCGLAWLGDNFRSWERGQYEAMQYLEHLTSDWTLDLVVCESFVPRPGVRTWQPSAIETIGVIRYLCERGHVPLEFQSPAEGKRFGTNAKLALLGWRNPTKGGHADDAARHLLLADSPR